MRKIVVFLVFLLTLFSVLGFSQISAYIAEKRPLITCEEWGFSQLQNEQYTHPQKLVVQPWLGPHNVYAIFLIPSGHSTDGLFTVTIPGTPTRCGRIQDIGKVLSGVDEPKYYTINRGYLNTRIALQLIAQGKLNQLKELDNWRLGYVRR
ncbi:hypothetical protein [Nodularia sp. UHCC 0506]|uniref:hypothetical protein n=1 Tax=Nodularia sp. UHCC 0506 TaxID=3110243 RepID=UPI002B1FFD9F|nr:hypothetical protein [Nodularia sp. UHCC 0506]MEA5514467.1 hypothetical protein [Nodularia sp. UHCC 0506]